MKKNNGQVWIIILFLLESRDCVFRYLNLMAVKLGNSRLFDFYRIALNDAIMIVLLFLSKTLKICHEFKSSILMKHKNLFMRAIKGN